MNPVRQLYEMVDTENYRTVRTIPTDISSL